MTDFSDMGLTTLSIRTALLGWQCSDYLHISIFGISRRSARLTTGPTGFIFQEPSQSYLLVIHLGLQQVGKPEKVLPTALVLELGPIDFSHLASNSVLTW